MTENTTYEEVLKPSQKMTKEMVKEYSYAANFSNEAQKEAIKEILLQPYMSKFYKHENLEARDVAEFVEKMTNLSFAQRTSIITQFSHNVLTTDSEGDNNGFINGVREELVFQGKLKNQLSDRIQAFVKQKQEERTPPAPEKKWWEKALRKAVKVGQNLIRGFAIAGGITLLAGGAYEGIKMYNENNNENNNKYGIVPTNNNRAMQSARDKIKNDEKTCNDAFSKVEKKSPSKSNRNMVKNNEIELG